MPPGSLLESHADRVLAETPEATTFRQRVPHALVERLRAGEPDITSVAEAEEASDEQEVAPKFVTAGVSKLFEYTVCACTETADKDAISVAPSNIFFIDFSPRLGDA